MNNGFEKLKNYVQIKTVMVVASSIALFLSLICSVFYTIIFNKIKFAGGVFWTFTFVSLVWYIASLIYYLKKDPVNNLKKYDLSTLLNYCNMSKGVNLYSEIITYITYICYGIIKDSNITKNNSQKIIAKAWRDVIREKNTFKNQQQYKNLCTRLDAMLKDGVLRDTELKAFNDRLEIVIDEFKVSCNDTDDVDLIKNCIQFLLNNLFIVLNIISCVLILIAFAATCKKITPLDTYLYGVATLLLVIYTILKEIKSKLFER